MIKIKAGHIDIAKLAEVQAALGEAFQKRMENELIAAFKANPPVIKIGAPIYTPPPLLPRMGYQYQTMRASYAAPTAHFSGVAAAVSRKTKRKDGREQRTCACGCCAYPHRAGSVEGCKS
jgi:hypothetical protein